MLLTPAIRVLTAFRDESVLGMIRKRDEAETLPLIQVAEEYRPIYSDALHNELLGFVLMLISALFFCTMTLLTRYALAYRGIDVPTMLVLRGSTQAILAFVSVALFAKPQEIFSVPRRLLPLLLLRGLLGASGLALYYEAMSILPLGIMTSMFFLNPIMTIFFSSFFLNERVGRLEMLAAFISLFGVVLIVNPTMNLNEMGSTTHSMGVMFALLSAGVVACAIVCVRSLGSQVHYMNNVVSFALWMSALGVSMGGLHKIPRDNPAGVLIALAACLAGFCGQCLFNKAFQHVRAGPGSVLRSIDVPLSYLLGITFLREVPHTTSLIGAGFVISGIALIGLGSAKK